MNGLTVTLEIRDAVSAPVATFIAGLRDRTGLHEAVSKAEVNLVRDHLLRIANDRHATAERLGASPSGHWAQAAEKTFARFDADAATIAINQVGIGRAAHDVDIFPSGMYLTLPLIAQAYNQRARRVEGLFFVKPAGKDYALLGQRTGAGGHAHAGDFGGGEHSASVTWWYRLVTEVHQKQDRSLLPTDEEFRVAAKEGVRNYVDYLLKAGGKS